MSPEVVTVLLSAGLLALPVVYTLDGVTYHRLASLGEAVAHVRQQLAAADRELVRHAAVYSRCKQVLR